MSSCRSLIRLAVVAGVATMACAVASGVRAQGASTGQQGPVTVVELFTSQGCSNCPPADALLKTLAARPGIVALSMSVDVWDYLGWRDTLATPKLSQRQRGYAKTLSAGKVYTPQMVVNGAVHVKGGNHEDVEAAIKRSADANGSAITSARLHTEGKMLVIDVAGAKGNSATPQATVWLAVVQRSVTVSIRKGDNEGRTFTYANVVRDLVPVGSWTGSPLTVRLQQAALARPADTCAVIVQMGTEGAIAGASPLTPC